MYDPRYTSEPGLASPVQSAAAVIRKGWTRTEFRGGTGVGVPTWITWLCRGGSTTLRGHRIIVAHQWMSWQLPHDGLASLSRRFLSPDVHASVGRGCR